MVAKSQPTYDDRVCRVGTQGTRGRSPLRPPPGLATSNAMLEVHRSLDTLYGRPQVHHGLREELGVDKIL